MSSLLIRNARVVPVTDPAPDEPVDVVVESGVVSAIVPRRSTQAGRDESQVEEVVEADGRWLIPGLWDQHTHVGLWTVASARLDLAATRTPEDVLAAVGQRIGAGPGGPVVGYGHRSGTWTRPATVRELDAVTGEVPVVLVSGDGHHAWVNSAGLRALELPPREDVVAEAEWFAAYPRLEGIEAASTGPAAYRATLERAAALGVVGLVDFEFGAPWEAWAERWHHGCDLLRVRWAAYASRLEEVLAAGLRTGSPLPGVPGGLATVGPLKIISDGSLNTRTAWCCEEYADVPGHHGAPNQTFAELVGLLSRAAAHGLDVATHAIGDRAVSSALAAYRETGARGSIEHAQLVRREDVGVLAELGLTASVQPGHLLDDRDVTERLWPDRAERCFAFRWMLDAGVRVVFGSDAPVSPLDPWLAMRAAVTRTADDRGPWHGEQILTRREALAASTDGQGTVSAGSRADLALLDRDPLAGTTDLRDVPVALTVMDGRITHRG